MAYKDSLPNFICEQTTERSVDLGGTGQWKHKDKFTELLKYVDHEESRTMLGTNANGSKSDTGAEIDNGTVSAGSSAL